MRTEHMSPCMCVCVRPKPSCKKTPIEAHVQVPELVYVTQLKQHLCLLTHRNAHHAAIL